MSRYKSFNEYYQSRQDEGLKNWAMGGLAAMSMAGVGCKGGSCPTPTAPSTPATAVQQPASGVVELTKGTTAEMMGDKVVIRFMPNSTFHHKWQHGNNLSHNQGRLELSKKLAEAKLKVRIGSVVDIKEDGGTVTYTFALDDGVRPNEDGTTPQVEPMSYTSPDAKKFLPSNKDDKQIQSMSTTSPNAGKFLK